MQYFDTIWKTFGRLVDSWCATVRWRVGIGRLPNTTWKKCWANCFITFGRPLDDWLVSVARLVDDYACHHRQPVEWSRTAGGDPSNALVFTSIES